MSGDDDSEGWTESGSAGPGEPEPVTDDGEPTPEETQRAGGGDAETELSDPGGGDPPSGGETGSPDEEGSRLLTAPVAAAAGVVVTAGLAAAGAFWPALTVLAGAMTASGLLLARRSGRKRYLLAGVTYCLGLAVVIEVSAGRLPPAYASGVLPAAGGFGAISAVLIIAKVTTKRAVKRLAVVLGGDEEYWAQVWEALAAFGSLLSLVWLLVTFAEKVVRYAGVSVGAVGLLVANMLGYRVTVQVFGIEVEAVLALFVGCMLVWFHLLDTLHNSWRAVARSAEKAQERRGTDADANAAASSDG